MPLATTYVPDEHRYDKMEYRRCGRSGVKLPAISLGMWHNFGGVDSFENSRAMARTAFDLGITHFDLANNYGPPYGSAEDTFGQILKKDFQGLRDELFISSKAGYDMWPGPYGNFGSKKYLVASLDQSLKRLGLDYVDLFYSHRPDPETPIEETMEALDYILRSGRALYVGISSYSPDQTRAAVAALGKRGSRLLIHQPNYSMFNRWIEDGLQDVLEKNGMGSIAFCPLAQGLLTNRYLNGVAEGSRAAKGRIQVEEAQMVKVRRLNEIAQRRGQSLAQMALQWVLRGGRVTSALIGASRPSQIVENVTALSFPELSAEELQDIDAVLNA